MWLQKKTLIASLVLILSACGQKGPLVINSPQAQSPEQARLQPSDLNNQVVNQKLSGEQQSEEQSEQQQLEEPNPLEGEAQ